MKIREGAYYRTRGGAVVGPIRRAQGGFWYSCFHTWDGDGGMFLNGAEHDLDLISEVYVSDTPPADGANTFRNCTVGTYASEAKTLRDEFAMAALTGFVANPNNASGTEESAQWAYRYADAMIEARKK